MQWLGWGPGSSALWEIPACFPSWRLAGQQPSIPRGGQTLLGAEPLTAQLLRQPAQEPGGLQHGPGLAAPGGWRACSVGCSRVGRRSLAWKPKQRSCTARLSGGHMGLGYGFGALRCVLRVAARG